MNDEQLTQRMRMASDTIEMSDSTQARHLEAISAALAGEADTFGGDVVPLASPALGRRRRVVATVIAAAILAPTGLAAASEGSLPGDALYPVKQLSERVIVLLDSDVVARHRIEEIEALEATGRFDAELYDDARAALSELGEGHPLWERLAAPSDSDDRPNAPIVRDDDELSEGAPSPATVTVNLPDGSQATLTIADGELTGMTPPAGWTVTELDDEEATLRSGDFEIVVVVRADGSLDTEITELRSVSDDDPSTNEDDALVTDADDEAPSSTRDDDHSSDSGDDPDGGDSPRDDDPSTDG